MSKKTISKGDMGDWGRKNYGPYSRENKKVSMIIRFLKILYRHIFLETKILIMEERLLSEKMRNGKINSPARKFSWKAFRKKLVRQRLKVSCICIIKFSYFSKSAF